MTSYVRRLDAIEATLGKSSLPNRLINFTFDDCDDREAKLDAALSECDPPPDKRTLVIVQWIIDP